MVLFAALLCCLCSVAQTGRMRCVSWNVENLFHPSHDSLKNDYQFMPEGEYRWTRTRYWRKLDNVARTIAALTDGDRWPALVGLCEVENDSAMHDLTRRSPLRAARYEYVMTESPDVRGVDVALMFQPHDFHLLRYEGIRVPSLEQGLRPTRNILHAVGTIGEGDTLHVLVVHLPSRAGGLSQGTENRRLAAATLGAVVDSLQTCNVLVMGDFNAEPGDEVFEKLMPPLRSLVPRKRSKQHRLGGTYFFQGRWSFLDHILVSERLWPRTNRQVTVMRAPFLLTDEGTPFRTYRGPIYNGGFSDHLPIWMELQLINP